MFALFVQSMANGLSEPLLVSHFRYIRRCSIVYSGLVVIESILARCQFYLRLKIYLLDAVEYMCIHYSNLLVRRHRMAIEWVGMQTAQSNDKNNKYRIHFRSFDLWIECISWCVQVKWHANLACINDGPLSVYRTNFDNSHVDTMLAQFQTTLREKKSYRDFWCSSI